MTFAQALARIEELQKEISKPRLLGHAVRLLEMEYLFNKHADSIVQLGKVAEKLANTVTAGASIGARGEHDLYQQARVLQALMKKGGEVI